MKYISLLKKNTEVGFKAMSKQFDIAFYTHKNIICTVSHESVSPTT